MSNTQPASETASKRPSVGVITGAAGTDSTSGYAASAVCDALTERGFDARLVDLQSGDNPLGLLRAAGVDSAFLTSGESALGPGCLQGLLEFLGIPYTGSSVLTVALADDRIRMKELLLLHNIPTVSCYEVKADELATLAQRQTSIGFPVEVRTRGKHAAPNVAQSLPELEASANACVARGGSAVVERVVSGTRYLVAILEGRVLGATPLHAPGSVPELTATRMRGLMNIAEQAAEALGCRGAVTVELLVTASQNEFVTNVDAFPDLAPESHYVQIAANAGFEFSELCVRLVRAARLDLQPRNLAKVTALPAASAEEPIRLAV